MIKKILWILVLLIVLTGAIVAFAAPMSNTEMADFEHLSEGAEIYPYDWMMALMSVGFPDENGKYTKPFFQDLDKRLGLFKSEYRKAANGKTYLMPYRGLSVTWSHRDRFSPEAYEEEQEIVREYKGVKGIRMVGTTCSFCHAGNLRYGPQEYYLPGSPSMTNVRGFFQDLLRSTILLMLDEKAMSEFLNRLKVPDAPAKAKELNAFFFRRLAETSHGTFNFGKLSAYKTLMWFKYFKDSRRLYQAKDAFFDTYVQMLKVTYGFKDSDNLGDLIPRMRFLGNAMVGIKPGTKETEPGFNRLDAFGRIGNMFIRGEHAIDNVAPVSFPWLWGTQYMAMMHYTANTNAVLSRNIGQALGLGGLVLDDGSTTVNIDNLHKLEKLVYKISVPDWNKVFKGEIKIDKLKAQRGEKLYQQNCAQCHESSLRVGPQQKLRDYKVYSLTEVGTDENTARDSFALVLQEKFSTKLFALLQGIEKKYCASDKTCQTQYSNYQKAFLSQRGKEFYRDTVYGYSDQKTLGNNYGDNPPGLGYKARHLSGIWATAPYLHNGSVPTLKHLLSPAKDRPKFFNVMTHHFDPENVGFQFDRGNKPCETNERACFDTTLLGNSNKGHEFGVNLSDAEKADLIEFLKVLKPEPEYL